MKESKELKTLTVALRSNYLAIQQVANKQDELKATFTTVSLVSRSNVPSNKSKPTCTVCLQQITNAISAWHKDYLAHTKLRLEIAKTNSQNRGEPNLNPNPHYLHPTFTKRDIDSLTLRANFAVVVNALACDQYKTLYDEAEARLKELERLDKVCFFIL